MHTVSRLGIAILLLGAVAFGHVAGRSAQAEPAVEVGPQVRIYGATAEQVELGRWAVRRFEAEGLVAPPIEIHFHGDARGCSGHLGFAKEGRVDVCTTLVNAMARRTLLHEMSHIWLDVNTDASVRERFLEFRGLREWNAATDPWQERGYEQGAEIISWVIGERILGAQIPGNDSVALEASFELLTGGGSGERGLFER
jgi:hypothetical protein